MILPVVRYFVRYAGTTFYVSRHTSIKLNFIGTNGKRNRGSVRVMLRFPLQRTSQKYKIKNDDDGKAYITSYRPPSMDRRWFELNERLL